MAALVAPILRSVCRLRFAPQVNPSLAYPLSIVLLTLLTVNGDSSDSALQTHEFARSRDWHARCVRLICEETEHVENFRG
jgi:hypothetical protein